MAPPRWATLERQLLAANVPACREFYDKYFDHARSPAVFRALGRERRTGRRVRELQSLAGAARPGRERRRASDVPQRPRRTDRAVHRGEDHRGADRAPGDVLQGVHRPVRLDAPRRGSAALQPHGPVDADGREVPAARPAVRRLLHGRGSRRRPTTIRSTRSSAAWRTAAADRCCERRPRSTGSATRSTSRGSTRCTASRRSSSSWLTTRSTAMSSAITS